MYVASEADETYLWQSYEIYENLFSAHDELLPISWEDLKTQSISAVTRNSEIKKSLGKNDFTNSDDWRCEVINRRSY